MDIGKSTRLAMADKNISGIEMAEYFGVSKSAISTYRSVKNQSGSKIEKLAKYFGMTSSEFVALGE
jgi:transcriptional regulator with XRE-family HTH domain